MAGLSISRADERAYRQKKAQEAEERIRGLKEGMQEQTPKLGPHNFGVNGNPSAAESGYLGKQPEQRLESVPYDPKTGEYRWDLYEQIPKAEGRPYRFIDGHKYYPPLPFPDEQETNPPKGVIPGRGPNAGKTPPLIIDNDWIRNFQRGYHDGPDNTPPGRIPLG